MLKKLTISRGRKFITGYDGITYKVIDPAQPISSFFRVFKPYANKTGEPQHSFICGVCGVVPNIKDKTITPTCSCFVHECGYPLQLKGTATLKSKLHLCGKCSNCCHCRKCWACGKTHIATSTKQYPKSLCKICGLCVSGCCTCKTCSVCGQFLEKDSACPLCHLHHSVCCDSPLRLSKAVVQPIFLRRRPKFLGSDTFTKVRSRRFLSVESEICGVFPPTEAGTTTSRQQLLNFQLFLKDTGCGVVEDISLPPSGFEINVSPAQGDAFAKIIHDLSDWYKVMGSWVDAHAGMHVHVDARDYRSTDIFKLIKLYSKVEYALFAVLPPWRRISKYAIPCGASLMKMVGSKEAWKSVKDAALDPAYLKKKKKDKMVVESSVMSRLINHLYDGNSRMAKQGRDPKRAVSTEIRYSALNIHAFFRMKTIEFRAHQGTTKEREMLMWPQVLAALLDFAYRNSIEEIDRLPKDPLKALLEVVKERSWVSKGLQDYVMEEVTKWCPEYPMFLGLNGKAAPTPTLNETKNTVISITTSDGTAWQGGHLGFNAICMAYWIVYKHNGRDWDLFSKEPDPSFKMGRWLMPEDLTALGLPLKVANEFKWFNRDGIAAQKAKMAEMLKAKATLKIAVDGNSIFPMSTLDAWMRFADELQNLLEGIERDRRNINTLANATSWHDYVLEKARNYEQSTIWVNRNIAGNSDQVQALYATIQTTGNRLIDLRNAALQYIASTSTIRFTANTIGSARPENPSVPQEGG